ncbi:hypothetical protein K431DRAFT_268619 [Polychaeton citri CBS 116435]|uniref:Glycoside hydrolase family 30 protein n=1 Tax=Polychaeton citri CBS 116435 TaxID=1314669 RepID=A0A9P4Q6G7_9PEZI|nr:hypothetical protein K431DRAFT_268619 [Polychaeton citri CBS 116435]
MITILRLVALATLAALTLAQTIPLTGSHTGIPRWCGKPYKAKSPNFDPGGRLRPPQPQPNTLLHLQVQSRQSIYTSSERSGEVIVDAALSNYHGQPYSASSDEGQVDRVELQFQLSIENATSPIASGSVDVNTTRNLFPVDLSKLEASLKPYNVNLLAQDKLTGKTYSASTKIYYLPDKKVGSTVKIDNLNGGMLMANNASNYAFEPILPYGFYTSCSGYLNYSFENVSAYAEQGYTGINPVCAFPDGDLDYLYNWLDAANVAFQYDLRGSYFNLTSVTEQVALVKDHALLLSWYTADEPDGWQYAFNSTTDSYNLLKELDPYHPTGLVLNCDNYYFNEYTIGTDYIMEDAYPVGIDPTYSRPWKTVCNETHGDCGCDNCVGSLFDISDRLDTYHDYQTWLGRAQKPLWAVPQAFSGEGYWARNPTQEEAWAMSILAFNHKAKGVMSWTFPAPEELEHAHSLMVKVVTKIPVKDFLLGQQPINIKLDGHNFLDVSYWQTNDSVLVGLVNIGQSPLVDVEVALPVTVEAVVSQPWGEVDWKIGNGTLAAQNVKGLETSFVIVSLKGKENGYTGSGDYDALTSNRGL